MSTDLGPKRIGTVNGEPWWTNGSIMVRGKLKTTSGGYRKQEGMQRVYDEAVNVPEAVQLCGKTKREGRGMSIVPLAPDGHRKDVEQEIIFIDERYYDYAKREGWSFWRGGLFGYRATSMRHVLLKKDGEIVGVVAPVLP